METPMGSNQQNKIFTRFPFLPEFLKFAVVGVLGTIVDFGIYSFLTRILGFYFLLATSISVLAAIINNFYLNKYWTFKKGQSGRTRQEYIKFFIVSIINYFLNLAITYAVMKYTHAEVIVGPYKDYFAKAVAIGIVLFSNYFGNKRWTFRD
jgi:putative flippase GtrA